MSEANRKSQKSKKSGLFENSKINFESGGFHVLVGDGVRRSKEGCRMPGVKKLFQESRNSANPGYIHWLLSDTNFLLSSIFSKVNGNFCSFFLCSSLKTTGKIVQLNYKYTLDEKGNVLMLTCEMIISAFVSIVVSEAVDILKVSIKNAMKNKENASQSLETRIYQVTMKALNDITDNKYKKEDILYEAAANILKQFKRGGNNYKEAVIPGLKIIFGEVTDKTCNDFLQTLSSIICNKKDDILYKQIELFYGSDTNKGVHWIIDKMESQENGKTEQYEMPIENRAEEYASRWDRNVFLNDFDEEDERAGDRVNVKLKDIYLEELLPDYIWGGNNQPSKKPLNAFLKQYIVDDQEEKMLLILGQPGIGKSTLITWIMANLVEKKDEILVYQFASDLKKVNWKGEKIFDEIMKVIKLRPKELGNKVLILDGFDEINFNGDRIEVLNRLNQELKNRLIITCRQNYIYKLQDLECKYITLRPWNEQKIKRFCEIYARKNGEEGSEKQINRILEAKMNLVSENEEIFGIPLILYLVLASNAAIENRGSIVDIFDQIFSPNGGIIYNRCIGISRYGVKHRIGEPIIRQQIYMVSQRIAFWIFENNSKTTFISREKFEEICNSVIKEMGEANEDIQCDVLIGSYFESVQHCEGKRDALQFVHHFIYDYYVAVYFFESICKLENIDEVANKLGVLLKKGQLSDGLLEFLKYKFDDFKGYNMAKATRRIFEIMLYNGSISPVKLCRRKYRKEVLNILGNMLKIICLWNSKLGRLSKDVDIYLVFNNQCGLELRGINLAYKDLPSVNLREANLTAAELYNVKMIGGNLTRADLSEADLREADLRGSDLRQASLREADLTRADLTRADLSEADLRGADLTGAILLNTNLSEADLRGADLTGATLLNTNLRGANLKDALLVDVVLRGADLRGTDCGGVCLIHADLINANLKDINLEGAILKKNTFDEKQVNELCERLIIKEEKNGE